MKTIRVLNLYACLGGNRYKWDEVAQDANVNMEVTAVELDPELARMYQERFPNDTVIVADAHQYLLDHYKQFDFIWSSPPCPTHSSIRRSQMNRDFFIPQYPDMQLYQEVLLLEHFFEGKYVVENVIPYYSPLIPAQKRGRHLYWTNFSLPTDLNERKSIGIATAQDEQNKLCKFHDIDLSSYKGVQSKVKISRNLVDYEAGRTISETALGVIRKRDTKQTELFEQ